MKAGSLSCRIGVERLCSIQDAIGQPVETWEEVHQCWADIRFTSGLEATRADSPSSTAKASIRIRWTDCVTPAMRVVHGDMVFSIMAVLPDLARREYVDLVCEVVS